MAENIKLKIALPELDRDNKKAFLCLETGKPFRGGIQSTAIVNFTDGTWSEHTLYEDFYKTVNADVTMRATKKAIETMHHKSFTTEAIDTLKTEALDFYRKKGILVAA